MSIVDLDAPADHPQWCNRRHQSGADPSRQTHVNLWTAEHRSNRLRVELHPSNGDDRNPPSVALVMNGMHQQRIFGSFDTRDIRSLAERLLILADYADRGLI